jgi:hypothetical protein
MASGISDVAKPGNCGEVPRKQRHVRAPLATLLHLLFFEKINSTIFQKCTIINNITNTYSRI